MYLYCVVSCDGEWYSVGVFLTGEEAEAGRLAVSFPISHMCGSAHSLYSETLKWKGWLAGYEWRRE